MSATTTSVEKVCTICGRDVRAERRTRDAAGRYYCQACATAAASRAASTRAATPPQAPTPGTPVVNVTPVETSTQVGGPQRVEAVLGGPDRYAGSPVLKLLRSATGVVGWKPSARPGQADGLAVAKWLLLAVPVLIATAFLLLGTRLAPPPSETGDGATFMALVGIVSFIGFVPLSITLAIRLGLLAAFARATPVRVASAIVAVLLLTNLGFAWPRLSEVWALASAGGDREHPLAFADLDAKLGWGAVANPAQWSKTSQQMSDEAAGLLGRRVSSWTGQVADVRDGQVLIDMRRSSLKNEVALKVGWWDEWKLAGINRGGLIEFGGLLRGYGDPYPYLITNGTIRSTRAASSDDVRSLLPE